MPVEPTPLDACETCEVGPFSQVEFLGLSVQRISANLGFGVSPTELTVFLYEDDCATPKYFYNEYGDKIETNAPNPGFFGMPRWERPDGSQYSDCVSHDENDTMIRDGIGIVGGPAFFKLDSPNGDSFEFAGIITDFVRTQNATDGIPYQVKITDPRIILAGVQLIIGDYSGRVDQTVGGGCATTNLFNLFGFIELFGNFCPPVGQCTEGVYDFVANHTGDPGSTCPGLLVDGEVFGTFMGGFGGSYWNESGMTLRYIIDAFNVLANSDTAYISEFSPYGRVVYYSYVIPPALDGLASGLILPDPSWDGTCTDDKFQYFVDLSDVPVFNDFFYRISGTSISLLDLIQKLSEDFNFDFYVTLQPVKDGEIVRKIIKVHVVYRTLTRSLGKICEFIQDQECVIENSIGIELRPEGNSKFIIGANKQSIYQAIQNFNPDSGFTEPPNDANELASLNNFTNTIDLTPGPLSIDDTIIPYWGLNEQGNIIVHNDDGSVDLPTGRINADLQYIKIPSGYIPTYVDELVASLDGYDAWTKYIYDNETPIWTLVIGPANVLPLYTKVKTVQLLRDLMNPKQAKTFSISIEGRQEIISDLQKIYQWVYSYARDYMGKKFAVRVPFTCAAYDSQTDRIRISEHPTNEGGWTEMPTVLGMPNAGNLSWGRLYDPLNHFRDERGRIKPFVRLPSAARLNLTDLNKNDYVVFALTSGGNTGSGPPTAFTSGIVYTDTDNGDVYIKDPTGIGLLPGGWAHISQYAGTRALPGSVPPSNIAGNIIMMVYMVDTGQMYVCTNYTSDGFGGMASCVWAAITYNIYVRAEVREQYAFHLRDGYYAPRVIIEIPQACRISILPGAQNPIFGVFKLLHMPAWNGSPVKFPAPIDAACIPLRSHSLTYGPWYNPSQTGAFTQIIVDESLAPWNYNGYADMNTAAELIVNESVSTMSFDELGSITVAGFPFLPLGSEIKHTPGLADSITTRTIAGNVVSGTDYQNNPVSFTYYTVDYDYSPWDGTNGPNITGISVDVQPNGQVTTTYNMRSFTTRTYGLNKWIVNRLRDITNLNNGLIQSRRALLFNDSSNYGYEI